VWSISVLNCSIVTVAEFVMLSCNPLCSYGSECCSCRASLGHLCGNASSAVIRATTSFDDTYISVADATLLPL